MDEVIPHCTLLCDFSVARYRVRRRDLRAFRAWLNDCRVLGLNLTVQDQKELRHVTYWVRVEGPSDLVMRVSESFGALPEAA